MSWKADRADDWNSGGENKMAQRIGYCGKIFCW